jgi:hypothetical protein
MLRKKKRQFMTLDEAYCSFAQLCGANKPLAAEKRALQPLIPVGSPPWKGPARVQISFM